MAQKQKAKLQQKKQKKAERQKKRQAKQRVKEAERAAANRYPKFRAAMEGGANVEFVDIAMKAARQINFEDRQAFTKLNRCLYEVLAWRGLDAATRCLSSFCNANSMGKNESEKAMVHFSVQVNEALYARIPEKVRRRFLPYQDLIVVPRGRSFRAVFKGLRTKRTPDGPIFYSPKRPTVTIGGEKKIVAYTDHAIERICQRLSPSWWRSFSEAIEVTKFFYNCKTFDQCVLRGDQQGITLHGFCGMPFNEHYQTYVGRILGEENLQPGQGDALYRVGHCPVFVHGEFAVAKTLLLPGYTATPEHRLIRRSSLPDAEKARLLDIATHQDVGSLRSEESIELTKWLHENGLPQVTQNGEQLFERRRTPKGILVSEPSTPTGLLPAKLEELCTV